MHYQYPTTKESKMDPNQIYQLMLPEEQDCLQVKEMSDSQRSMLLQWAVRMITHSANRCGEIDAIKYDGRLIVLDDGSRWEVDETDSFTSDLWSEMDRVVIIDGEMFKLDDFEKVSVEEEA